MSGGVDSSTAAWLLKEQGHEVVGVFMRHHEPAMTSCSTAAKNAASLLPIVEARPDHKQGCCSASDADDGRRVADRLKIPFYALDLQDDFDRIIDYFVDEYTAGRTPNPCVMCNNWLKFGRLFDYADGIGADYVATGHYAQMHARDGSPALLRGRDASKDQSYVLFGVGRERLARMLLPVGGYLKPEIRAIAGELGLRVADKKDSQEICFVAGGKHDEFVRARSSADTSGEIVLESGEVVGHHPGIEGFTIGQRKGLNVAMGDRYFVLRIEPQARRVVIGPRDSLARRELTANRVNWLVEPPTASFRGQAQIRYNSQAAPATIEPLADDRLQVVFDEPRHGVAPGQAVVVYDPANERVLGGGWIE